MVSYRAVGIARGFASLGFRRYNSTLQTAITSSLLTNLFPSCKSCGVRLQSVDPKKPGYYLLEEKPQKKFVKKEDEVFEKFAKELSLEDKKLLVNDFTVPVSKGKDKETSVPESEKVVNEINPQLLNNFENKAYFASELKKASQKERLKLEEKHTNSIECIRCRDATYRSNFKEVSKEEYPLETLDSIVTKIPPHERVIYIINAQDFPMSLNPKIFQYRSPQEVKFIVNKADLLFKAKTVSAKYGQTFFSDYLFHKYRVPKENVMVVSGVNYWDFNKLLNFIDDNSYLIGNVNSGKSTIIKSILYTIDKSKKGKKLLSSRDRTKLEKEQDVLINRGRSSRPLSSGEKKKEQKRYEELFRAKVGPGVSYMPGFTRGFIQIDLEELDKTIYDVPGFVNTQNQIAHHHEIYSLIESPKILKQIHKGVKVYDKGFYTSKYETVKGGRCISMGGLFYLNFPQGSMFQVRNCINADFHLFNNFSKAVNVSLNLDKFPGMVTKFFIHHNEKSLSQYRRYIIPPFYGSIDLVIQNLGHLNIKPTGKRASNEPLILHLPLGLEASIRLPITNYIAKTFTGRDAKGNPLRKEHIVSKSVLALQRYAAKYPFYSNLINSVANKEGISEEMALSLKQNGDPFDDETYNKLVNEDYARISEWASIGKGMRLSYDNNTVIDERNKFDFWIE
ncbi:genetic interactor of prohibitins 3, mitochondrial [Scheffersomyces xylosifermentans]|uniref:genetic interactor of prohibitins 3, mitochondrial n=1 Tax=Scheffersomyces xylosifermentans TaxID=1304137 RepID=UPI00315E0321